jgi:hypothetical protein
VELELELDESELGVLGSLLAGRESVL